MMSNTLTVENLKSGYSMLTIIQDIDFEIMPGEVTGIIGLNGSGKTTLFNALMGLTWIKADKLLLGKQQLKSLATWKRKARGLTLLPQKGLIFANLTIEDNLRFSGIMLKEFKEFYKSPSLRKIVQTIAKRPSGRAGNLSGGEQRVLGIAMALAKPGTVILADEPTLGLTKDTASEMFDLLANYATIGRASVVIISHEYGHLSRICDKIYIMKNGRISDTVTKKEFTKKSLTEFLFTQ
jgi:branched-chain amino acid transport system ATP-binding protein